MVKARKYVVKRHFTGKAKREDFEIVEVELPPIKNGEILVKTEWISVDAYLRIFGGLFTPPYDQFGYQVGVVLESKDPRFPTGSRVVSHKGWCDHSIINASEKPSIMDTVYKLPNLKDLPVSLGVGAVGMHGATAYFAFLEICKPKAGETVVITGAAGAVGTLVGQIAKIKGCKVIGFTGSDEKVKWLEGKLKFDKAINYKTADVDAELKKAAPNGVDCYFDNVGGEISSQIMRQMNAHGRVAVVGAVSSYNDEPGAQKASTLQSIIVANQLKLEGFVIWSWDRWNDAFTDLVDWISSGQIKAEEHVTEGFENLFEAYTDMMDGKNFGKAVVKV